MFNHSNLKICNPKTYFKGKLLSLLSLNKESLLLNFTKLVIQNKELFVPCLMSYWKVRGSSSLYSHYKSHTALCYISKYLWSNILDNNAQNWQKNLWERGWKGIGGKAGSYFESLESRAGDKGLSTWEGDQWHRSVPEGRMKQGKKAKLNGVLFSWSMLRATGLDSLGIFRGSIWTMAKNFALAPLLLSHQGQKIAYTLDKLFSFRKRELLSYGMSVPLHTGYTCQIASGQNTNSFILPHLFICWYTYTTYN